MRKTYDYEHHYEDHDNNPSICRIRVFEEGGRRPVVVATELSKNEGASVSSAAEFIAADLIKEDVLSEAHLSHEVRMEAMQKGTLEPISNVAPFVLVEERIQPKHTFSFLWFHSYEILGLLISGKTREYIGQPEWQPTSREEVEELVGASLDGGLQLSSHSLIKIGRAHV